LAKEYDKSLEYKMDLAESYGRQGDFVLRANLLEAAAESYLQLRKYLGVVINADPENISWLPEVAKTHERVAMLSLRQNNPKEAAHRYQEAMKYWDELVQTEPNNLTWRTAHAVALANVGKTQDARKAAVELVARCGSAPGLLIQLARCNSICAAISTEADTKKQATGQALALLKQAADFGWKDARTVETDPAFKSLSNDAGFKALIERMRGTP